MEPQQHAAAPGAQADVFPPAGEAARENQHQHPVQNPFLAGMQPQLQQQVLQQQQEANQLPIAAIATHFWLLLRIFGMLWFFSGAGWQRTFMLSLCGLAIYIFQAGILRERVLGNHWDRFRRYFENLVGIPHPPPPQQQRAARDQANEEPAVDIGPPARRRRRREPSPEEVAHRLLQEHQQQRRTWFRERLRGVERSLALFVASLWPGLGERMVAAREEAEAQARRDAQDREEAERREAAEAEAEAAAAAAAAAQAQSQAQESGAGEGESAVADDASKQESSGNDVPAAADSDKVDKGKGRAVDVGEASSSSSVAPPAGSGDNDGVATSRQRDGWSFDDLD
ncbi:hypothetical protein DBV05_g3755 [Lasiodiplodia theobromae]|uniref:Uncharacterized protein n=1 Tax=Lasiodiplodia theobromae TaxID=45133 RepID=A0A5N5DJ67_9PEZI|nr:hypothetical protein DBV05_g3755 [Lasiodiplodia theobromae]